MIKEIETAYQLVFFSTLVVLVLLEQLPSLQRSTVQTSQRWTSNVGLFLVVGMLARLTPAASALAFSMHQPAGLLQQLAVPAWVQTIFGFVLLDFWYYWLHRLYHQVPLLWRAHLVHHSDTDVDVTTAERHHPIEVLLSSTLLLSWIFLLEISTQALGLYICVSAFIGLTSHANINFPESLDRRLRLIFVTSKFHAIHHSALKKQTNSNYALVFTIWDRIFGTYTHPEKLLIKNFGLEYFNKPNETYFSTVLIQPFLKQVASENFENEIRNNTNNSKKNKLIATLQLSKAWQRAFLSAGAGLALFMVALWPTALGLISTWQSNEAYRHGWLVVPVVIYLLGWHFRDELIRLKPAPTWTGAVFALISSMLWLASEILDLNIGREIGFAFIIHSIVISAFGWKIYKNAFPTLALLFLMIPNGDAVQPILKLITKESIDLFSSIIELPHTTNGFSIAIGKLRYIVVDACSGLAHFNLLFFLGYFFGLMLFRSTWKIIALALVSGGLGILSNVIRVNTIVLLDWFQGTQMSLTDHGNIQWLGLGLVFSILFLILAYAKPDTADCTGASESELPLDQREHCLDWPPILAGLSVFLSACLAINLSNQVSPISGVEKKEWTPPTLNGWTTVSPTSGWEFDHSSETRSLSATYQRNDQIIRLTVIESISVAGKLPTRLLPSAASNQWRDIKIEPKSNCPTDQCESFWHSVWMRGSSDPLRHLYYAFSVGTFTTESMLALRAANGWQRLTGGTGRPRLIGLTFEGKEPSVAEVAPLHRQIRLALLHRENSRNQ